MGHNVNFNHMKCDKILIGFGDLYDHCCIQARIRRVVSSAFSLLLVDLPAAAGWLFLMQRSWLLPEAPQHSSKRFMVWLCSAGTTGLCGVMCSGFLTSRSDSVLGAQTDTNQLRLFSGFRGRFGNFLGSLLGCRTSQYTDVSPVNRCIVFLPSAFTNTQTALCGAPAHSW